MRRIGILMLTVMLGMATVFSAPQAAVAQSNATPAAKALHTSAASTEKLDINSVTKEQLQALAGIGDALSQKIIDNRPYRTKRDLVTKKIIPQSTYEKIKDQIIAHRASAKASQR